MLNSLTQTIIKASGIGKQVTTGAAVLTILSDVSFEVRAGEAVAIVGVSGSGKSTLLGLLAGLDTPSAGSVRIDGHDLYALDEDGRAALRGRMVGFVFQSFLLLPSLTALDNVLLAGKYVGAAKPESRRRALGLLEQFGVLERRAHYPRELSGGEQQRVAFCRAILNDPPLLLADEPTGNLDPDMAAEIMALFQDVNSRGTTVLVATHDREMIQRMGKRLIGLDRGRVTSS